MRTFKKSKVNANAPIRIAHAYQFLDPAKGMFLIGLQPPKTGAKFLRGMPLYEDATGQRWALA